ncbi:N-acetylmuramic acid 6-phosphate etherase 2 [Companilactobacillus sp. RD055328]|uniref:N-acetylmuramic acid 6-phosphate etherase n=1 Tax=Companilactobacillus sp. RD055328 TaxID=2916634 RepID=UPI001FC7CFE2|nr:N-acetylmuramic acid 6-phosphate etherase [Companilactobacillus sp. RD055328]GKQ43449.1 N-acetylmuramic acid 6-phosphate etherase 2 [Companilactobacillus sp. RD055328]
MESSKLTTEQRNEASMNLDEMSVIDIVSLMNSETTNIMTAIEEVKHNIVDAVDLIILKMKEGGKLYYVGAGTSGRLGILDASECVPTFGTDPTEIQGIIAGGKTAIIDAVEGAEDSVELADEDFDKLKITDSDVVVGIAASGRTPYVIEFLKRAKEVSAATVAISNNKKSQIGDIANVKIEVEVGPEVLTGSTRLKSGTAQKMVLNMLSTISLVKMGKVFENLMIDVQPTNEKLVNRAINMVDTVTNIGKEKATQLFTESGKQVKVAIVMNALHISRNEAEDKLKKNKGYVREAIQNY